MSLALAVLPWSAVANALLTDGPAPDPLVIRAGQVLLLLAALGTVPALWRTVVAFPLPGRRWAAIPISTAIVAAFAVLIFTLLVGGILEPSLSY